MSHEMIYRSLYVQSRGVLRRELTRTCGLAAACAARKPTAVSTETDAAS